MDESGGEFRHNMAPHLEQSSPMFNEILSVSILVYIGFETYRYMNLGSNKLEAFNSKPITSILVSGVARQKEWVGSKSWFASAAEGRGLGRAALPHSPI